MRWYDGPTWTVGEEDTDDFYVFTSEKTARWFQACRTVTGMHQGSQPLDGGYFFMTPEEREEVLRKEPALVKFIHRVYGSKEFIQNIERYCFWLADASPEDIKKSKILYERVKSVKDFRSNGGQSAQKAADKPSRWNIEQQPDTTYLLIPRVSSERRQYIPMGYVTPEMIATDSCIVLEHATPYHFGILTSRVHMAWMRVVCGRLTSRYRYSARVVYNNFVWPLASPWQVKAVETTAQRILDVRTNHPDCSYASLYDEVSMPKDLREAHRANDAAVAEVYGLPADMDEHSIVFHMFGLMQEAIDKKQRKRK